jgi:hypothetical protein
MIVNGDPEVTVNRMITSWRNHCETRHDPRSDAPVVLVIFGISPHADEQTPTRFVHLENWLSIRIIVLVALCAFE